MMARKLQSARNAGPSLPSGISKTLSALRGSRRVLCMGLTPFHRK